MNVNISEIDVMRFIIEKLNSTVFNQKIKFRVGQMLSDDITNNFIFYRMNLFDDGRFDITETIDQETYDIKKHAFVPTTIDGMNAEYTNIEGINIVSYDLSLSFLISMDGVQSEIIRMAIESFRNSMRGALNTYKIEIKGFETVGNAVLSIVSAVQNIVYSGVVEIQGKSYQYASLPISLQVSEGIVIANQIEFELAKYNENPNLLDFQSIKPITFSFGLGQSINSVQLLKPLNPTIRKNSNEIKGFIENKGFSFAMLFLLDLRKDIHKEIYKDMIKVRESYSTYVLRIRTKVLNETTMNYEYDNDLTETRTILSENITIDNGSYGEPVIVSIGVLPAFENAN